MTSVPLSQSSLAVMCTVLSITVLAACYLFSRYRPLPSVVAGKRYDFIDGLRGIAALMVFLNHAPLAMIIAKIPENTFHVSDYETGTSAGALGVQIFFGITGFLFFRKLLTADGRIDWNRFFANRVRRLVPLYYFACAVALAIGTIVTWPLDDNLGEAGISALKMLTFGFVPTIYVGRFDVNNLLGLIWTVMLEWRFYLFMPIFAWALTWRLRWLAFAGLVLVALLDLSRTQLACWAFFIPGFIAANLEPISSRASRKIRLLAVIAACGFLLANLLSTSAPEYGLTRFALFTGGFIALVFARPALLATRALRYLGEISYSFYILHATVLFVSLRCANTVLQVPGLKFGTYLAMMSCISAMLVLICTLTYRYIMAPIWP